MGEGAGGEAAESDPFAVGADETGEMAMVGDEEESQLHLTLTLTFALNRLVEEHAVRGGCALARLRFNEAACARRPGSIAEG